MSETTIKWNIKENIIWGVHVRNGLRICAALYAMLKHFTYTDFSRLTET